MTWYVEPQASGDLWQYELSLSLQGCCHLSPWCNSYIELMECKMLFRTTIRVFLIFDCQMCQFTQGLYCFASKFLDGMWPIYEVGKVLFYSAIFQRVLQAKGKYGEGIRMHSVDNSLLEAGFWHS
ncbi:hypothetical protein Dimus_033639 [Dionaea muscipula]